VISRINGGPCCHVTDETLVVVVCWLEAADAADADAADGDGDGGGGGDVTGLSSHRAAV